ncbi:MAG: YggS family pyridoxal phosphate-dependent enzyme [Betaproteobacteria bacterium]
MIDLPSEKNRLTHIGERIEAASLRSSNKSESVKLIAVSKTFSDQRIRDVFKLGQRRFGENYVQEAIDKIDALSDLDIEWHFIGPIQSNKTKLIAAKFDWVHSIDRLKIAERLSAARPAELPKLNVCVQVNVTGEQSKHGCSELDVMELGQEIAALPNLNLRGLMTISETSGDLDAARSAFRKLREIADQMNQKGLKITELSMGMSDDLEVGIEEGATFVRVGRGIFGDR